MDRTRHLAERALFEALFDLTPTDRARRLAALTDPALAERLRALLDVDTAAAEGVGPTCVATLDVGDRLGAYTIQGVLGRGGMATVYAAEQDAPRRRVALKRPHPWLWSPALDALVLREGQALADVRHPGIPTVHEVLALTPGPVVVMELVEGAPIDHHAVGLDWRGRVELLARVVDAVAAAHRRGIVHRDIKPSNVLVTADRQPKLIDFGVADVAGTTSRSGTPEWMAPEVRRGEPCQPASDVYALGRLGVQLLDGAVPPSRVDQRQLDAVLQRASDAATAARYTDAGALYADLRRALAGKVVTDLAGHLPTHLATGLRRLRAVAAPVQLLVFTLAGAAWCGRGAVDAALRQHEAARSLDQLAALPAGDQLAAIDALLADPALVATPAFPRAWSARAARVDGAARGEALTAAWLWSDGPSEPGARDKLVRWLLDEHAVAIAAAFDPPGDPAVREAVALAHLELDSPSIREEVAAIVAPLRLAAPVAPGPGALDAGRLWVDGQTLRFHPVHGDARTWRLPAPVDLVALESGRFVLRAEGPSVITGRVDRAELVHHPTPCVATSLSLQAPPGVDALIACHTGNGGVWTVGPTGVAPLAGSSAGMPARRARAVSMDDTAPGHPRDRLAADAEPRPRMAARAPGGPSPALAAAEPRADRGTAWVAVAASGWRDHELRLIGPDVTLRARMSAWDLAPLGDRLLVLGGPLPAAPSPRGPQRALVPTWVSGGALLHDPPIPLREDAQQLHLLTLGGRAIAAVTTQNGVELVDVDQPARRAWLPGLAVVAAGQADEDEDTELWVRGPEGSWILGAGATPLPPRPRPVVTPTPILPAGAPHPAAWSRALQLASRGQARWLGPALGPLLPDDTPPSAIDDLLDHLGHPPPGDLPPALLHRLRALPTLTEAVRRRIDGLLVEQVGFDLPAAPRPQRDALPNRAEPAERRTDELLVEQLGFDLPTAPPEPTTTLTFDRPLPAGVSVGGPAFARRDLLGGALRLHLTGDGAPALRVPLRWDGPAICATLALSWAEIDWAAGATLALTDGVTTHRVHLRRVGGGARADHVLSLSADGVVPSLQAGDLTGPHEIVVCLTRDAPAIGLRIDDAAMVVAPVAEALRPGPVDLVLLPHHADEYSPSRAGRLDLRAITVHGAAFNPDAAADPLLRSATEGDVDALRTLRGGPDPRQRAAAAELLGDARPADLLGLSDAHVAALLRRDARTWTPIVAATRSPAALASIWLRAWGHAITYQDPPALGALLDPALSALPLDHPDGRALALARASALLHAGQLIPARQLLDRLRPLEPEATWLSARLERRAGHPEAAARDVRAWLASAGYDPLAVDRLADDPELAPLVPELVVAPIWRW